MRHCKATIKGQRGAVLIMALLLVMVLTILGVSAMQGGVMEERMAGNAHDHHMAFQSAESGLRDATAWIDTLSARPKPDSTASKGIYEIGILGDNLLHYTFDWVTMGRAYGTGTGNHPNDFSYHSAAPLYVVEETAFVVDSLDPDSLALGKGVYYYTVSSIGHGGSTTSEAVARTVWEKRYN